MKYRKFGNTGVEISSLGFGCMRLPMAQKDGKNYIDEEKAIPMLRRAYEKGVNYFDTAIFYCEGQSQTVVGKALKPFREKVLISTKLPPSRVKEQSDFRKGLEQALKELDTSYIDFYHFHGINKNEFDNIILKFNLLDEARKAIDEGLIRHISFSFHDKPEVMKYIIDTGEIFSSVLMQYNLLDRKNEQMLEYAHSKGLGTVIMGPVAGGRLAAPGDLYKKLMGKESKANYELALRFVLGNPNVSCALSGMENIDMLDKNVEIAGNMDPLTPEENKKCGEMMEEIKKFSDLYCTGCGYCQPCPKDIKIPHIFNAYTYKNVYGLDSVGKNMYDKVGRDEGMGNPVSQCIDCRVCANKCPQNIDIPKKLKEIHKAFNEQ